MEGNRHVMRWVAVFVLPNRVVLKMKRNKNAFLRKLFRNANAKTDPARKFIAIELINAGLWAGAATLPRSQRSRRFKVEAFARRDHNVRGMNRGHRNGHRHGRVVHGLVGVVVLRGHDDVGREHLVGGGYGLLGDDLGDHGHSRGHRWGQPLGKRGKVVVLIVPKVLVK